MNPSFWKSESSSKKLRRNSAPSLGHRRQSQLPVDICPFCEKAVGSEYGHYQVVEGTCKAGHVWRAHSGLQRDCSLGCFEQYLYDLGFCHKDPHCHLVSNKKHCREVHHFTQGTLKAPDTPRPFASCLVCDAEIAKVRYIRELDFTIPSEFELEIKQNERDWKARQKRDKNMAELKTSGKPFTLDAYLPNLGVFGLRDLCGLDIIGDGQKSVSNLQDALVKHLAPDFPEVLDAPVDPVSGLILFPASVFDKLDKFVLWLTVRNPIKKQNHPDPTVTIPHPGYCNESFMWHFCPNLVAGNPCPLIHPWNVNWAYMDGPDVGLIPQVRDPIAHMSVISAWQRSSETVFQSCPAWETGESWEHKE